jgi:Protein of unknown function (DUF3313)
MNGFTSTMALGLVSALAMGAASAMAQDAQGSFLSDYSRLTAAQDGSVDRIYIAPDSLARLGSYKSVMVEQPELALSPDSRYKSMKPDDMKLIADSLRAAITNELKDGYQIVEAPGPGVLYIRAAVGNLHLRKHNRSIFSKQIDVSMMTIEAEVLDSQSLDQLSAMTATRGSLDKDAKEGATSWDEMTGLFSVLGKRLRCRLDNAGKPESQWTNCTSINLPAPAAG